MKRIAPEIEQAIVIAWTAGERSTTLLARRHDIGSGTVRACLERNGLGRVPRPSFPRKTTVEQDADIVRLYGSGLSASQIAVRYGLEQQSVLNRIHAAGIHPHVKGGTKQALTEAQLAEAIRLRGEGIGVVQIGLALGIGYPRVRRALHDNGMPTWNLTRRKRLIPLGGYIAYAVDPDDPLAVMANSRGYIPQHRYVMAQSLGRPLTKSETVHHINGDGTDNRVENLQLRQGRHGKHVVYSCLDCGSHNVAATPL